MRKRPVFLVPPLAVAVFLADLFSKSWALANLQQGNLHPLLSPLIGFTLVTNTGTAFGMGQSTPAVGYVLPPLICAAIVFWIVRREQQKRPLTLMEAVGFGLILGGACGNMYDRFVRGQVTDFLYFVFWPTFPVFNVADALIDVGVALLILHSLGAEKHRGIPPPAGRSGTSAAPTRDEGGIRCDGQERGASLESQEADGDE